MSTADFKFRERTSFSVIANETKATLLSVYIVPTTDECLKAAYFCQMISARLCVTLANSSRDVLYELIHYDMFQTQSFGWILAFLSVNKRAD